MATLMAYAQQLVDKKLTFRTINNYFSALKSDLDRLGIDTGNFEHRAFKAFF